MSSMFERLSAVAGGVLDTVFGEVITIMPMDRTSGPNGARGASLTRPAWNTAGAKFYQPVMTVDEEMPSQLMQKQGSVGGMFRAGLHTVTLRIPVGKSAIEGDLIHRHKDDTYYEINRADPNGLGEYTFAINVAKRPV